MNVLLEGVPEGIAVDGVAAALRRIPGVQDTHDLHVWAISSGKPALTAHLLLNAGADSEAVRLAATLALREGFGIRHCTLQCEFTPCDSVEDCALVEAHSPEAEAAHRH